MDIDLSFLYNLESAILCRFRKGQYLAQQGEPLNYIYYIVEGRCERLEYTENGEEILFNEKTADRSLNAIVGLHTLWTVDFCNTSSFIALTDVVCYRIDAAIAKDAIQQRADILDAVISELNSKYLYLRDLYKSRQTRRVPNQICMLLVNQIRPTEKGLLLPKKMSNVNISHQLNVHPVTVAKVMSFLQKEGILRRTEHGVQVLDVLRLQEYAQNKKIDIY